MTRNNNNNHNKITCSGVIGEMHIGEEEVRSITFICIKATHTSEDN